MQYSLRTLVILAALAPPLIALAWYGATLARHYSDDLRNLYFSLVMLLNPAIVLVTFFHVPGDKQPAKIRSAFLLLLWAAEFAALWYWAWVTIHAVGWLFIWGDMGPRVSELTLVALAAVISAGIASITSLRVMLGLATPNYVRGIVAMTAALIFMSIPACVHLAS